LKLNDDQQTNFKNIIPKNAAYGVSGGESLPLLRLKMLYPFENNNVSNNASSYFNPRTSIAYLFGNEDLINKNFEENKED